MSKIEWTNETWNPIVGCSKLSPGCQNCYAEKMALRLVHMPHTDYYAFVLDNNKEDDPEKFKYLPKWNGQTHLNEEGLYKPLSWKKPRMVFVISMGDLFHESTPFKEIDKVMAIIAISPKHTFQILTKRANRMHEYFSQGKETLIACWEDAIYEMGVVDKQSECPDVIACYVNNRAEKEWPFKNIWLGVTAENQEQADKRIPILNEIPAAVKFVSIEPMLSAVDLNKSLEHTLKCHAGGLKNCLSWVICGGESGHKARPMHPNWVRSLRDQCKTANVPFFFKQWGEWMPGDDLEPAIMAIEHPKFRIKAMHAWNDKKEAMLKVGKKYSGHLLDGEEYHQFPQL
jgi:protein gp37